MRGFAASVVAWQQRHGRHDLPWQASRDPYRVWLAEVMLQQTQVAAVIPYYRRFLERFPDVGTLAAASQDEVLRLWSGLGYYARGRNLHAAARALAAAGEFPRTADGLRKLPGVGRTTAGAIAVFAFGRRAAILDGNVKRVLARCFGVQGEARQWALAERLLPRRDLRTYTQALMDLGATVCARARPDCDRCPVARGCVARREGRIGELPASRARKALPTRRATWYVHLQAGKVLLERRREAGLWGGLWTFPERRLRGAKITRRLPALEHGFTHFRLRAQPVLCAAPGNAAPGQLWLDLADAPGAAVPTPVRRVLRALLPGGTHQPA
ncbi:MAG: A/G-specific adenine glycosylase [Betaproteobacteria bacterium]|nr:A/G-specific adenine glycosylase [Betaproteobacteria bacterium]MDH5219850.1 A/G-specific adenine glycosylase [Betaproteobacteria bacterium]MDH5349302.1 A/G-specific adenine glycosylase [Betaproteobacteria bacterium]